MILFFSILFYLLTLHPVNSFGQGEKTLDKAEDLLTKGKPAESISLLQSYRPVAEELSRYHYLLASAFKRSRRFQDYLDQLRLSYIYAPKEERPRLLLERAEAYMSIGYYPEASLLFKLFLREFTNSPPSLVMRAYRGLGESLYNLGHYDEAVNHFSRAGDNGEALYGVAKSLQATGKIKEAEVAFRKAIERDKDFLKTSEETLYRYGENLFMTKRYDEAKRHFILIKNSRLRAKADLLLGTMAKEQGRFNDALRYLNSAYVKGDRETKRSSLFQMAMVFINTGKKDEAKEKLLDIKLHYPYGKIYDRANLELARLYRESGEMERAISLLKELVFRRPPVREAIDEFESIILSVAERDREGLLRLWNSIGNWLLEPSRSETLIKVARLLRGSGIPFLKLTSWLIKYGDSNTKRRAGILLADLYADLGEPVRAQEYLKLSGMKATGNDDFHRTKARISLINSNLKDAVNSLLSIRELKGEDLSLISEVIDSIRDRNSKDFKALVNQYMKVAGEKGSSIDYVRLGDILYSLNRKDEALFYYRKAVSEKGKGGQEADLDWASYRINRISGEGDVISMIKGDRLKGVAGLISREIEIEKMVKEVF